MTTALPPADALAPDLLQVIRVLLVEDDEDDYSLVRDWLNEVEEPPFQLDWVPSYDAALPVMRENRHDVYLLDYRLGKGDGLKLLRVAASGGCRGPMILLTGQGDREVDMEAMRAGAADYLPKGQINALFLERAIRHVIDRKRNEQTIDRLAAIVESSDAAIISKNLDGIIATWNPAAERLYGYSAQEVIGQSISIIFPPDCSETLRDIMERIRNGERIKHLETTRRRKDGTYIDVMVTISPISTRHGQIIGASSIAQDIGPRKRLEQAFRQAQKMEAIGTLAGGVAHDFNNFLTVIMGFSEVLLTGGSLDDSSRSMLREIRKAGERGSSLTRQLLAFSRRLVLQPVVLSLNTLVEEMEKMLRRLIGEDIDLATRLEALPGTVKADPGQIEQVIMNLVVNARDAMPTGGQLTIETRDVRLDQSYADKHPYVHPGSYVMLAVSDTGCGMDEATRTRIFEPFFTTKEIGKGTGLGLATVYGIVKQSGGSIEVYSELGQGSTFKVYLPCIHAPAFSGKSISGVSNIPKGTETILVTEDEEDIRSVMRLALQSSGYTVLEAKDGDEGIQVCKEHQGPIHLLLTDVVMPKKSGRQLADTVKPLRHEMKVLYVSGYTDDAIVRHGVLEAETAFLQKPFTPGTLLRKVRAVLDG